MFWCLHLYVDIMVQKCRKTYVFFLSLTNDKTVNTEDLKQLVVFLSNLKSIIASSILILLFASHKLGWDVTAFGLVFFTSGTVQTHSLMRLLKVSINSRRADSALMTTRFFSHPILLPFSITTVVYWQTAVFADSRTWRRSSVLNTD